MRLSIALRYGAIDTRHRRAITMAAASGIGASSHAVGQGQQYALRRPSANGPRPTDHWPTAGML